MDSRIRKALEEALGVALPGMGLAADDVWWPNWPFDLTNRDKYLRMTHHPTGTTPDTVGRNPRETTRGFTKIGIQIREGVGTDEADDLAKKIVAAYPYVGPLVKDGVSVEIRRRDEGTGDTNRGWYYQPVDIYWVVWRS